jgi:hypothetical protein
MSFGTAPGLSDDVVDTILASFRGLAAPPPTVCVSSQPDAAWRKCDRFVWQTLLKSPVNTAHFAHRFGWRLVSLVLPARLSKRVGDEFAFRPSGLS